MPNYHSRIVLLTRSLALLTNSLLSIYMVARSTVRCYGCKCILTSCANISSCWSQRLEVVAGDAKSVRVPIDLTSSST
ncbi:hypothetical protein [Chamaesiphon minutus]|uniref:hypothetical protein n=1 Tax=Chamaesiphon minutus TaxID=1173032 RepID=UPI0003010BEC|nr:hypothetical protein [Chamaesiphon minutus]